ncbi:MAG: hypothetical protein H7Y00_00165 [Fimbriimonadaceae bacterium]|nr:hypothetical protein [Chitinophagales bacterium]
MKTNIYSKYMHTKKDDALVDVLQNNKNAPDMRLAAIWELQKRNLFEHVPENLENELNFSYETKRIEMAETIKTSIHEDRDVIPKIKWAAYLLFSTVFLHIVYFILMKNTFYINLLANSFYLVTFIVRSGIVILIGIYLLQGQQWPRIVALILFILGSVSIASTYFQIFVNDNSFNAYGIFFSGYIFIQLAIFLLSLILLFSRDASDWYKGYNRNQELGVLDEI